MAQQYNNVLSSENIDYILNLPQVQASKSSIDSKVSGSIYFTVNLTNEIKTILNQKIGLDLINQIDIPMRWIKGDTPSHIDTGVDDFNNTYLIYLTDSNGSLILDNVSYPITKGTAYVFNESLKHETINTGSEARLLLGPMSELGFPVGGITSIQGPGNSTIYIRQAGSDIQYSSDQTTWNILYFPCVVINTNTSLGYLKIEFITNITINNQWNYLICDPFSSNGYIQFGSSSLKNDGTRPIITIDGVTNYDGFIQNGTNSNNGCNNISIYNLEVSANNSTLADKGGWIGQQYYSKGVSNNYIINCSSNGNIGSGSSEGGGIVGSYVATGSGSSLTIIGCSSSGNIGINSGGIVGTYAGNTGNPFPPAGGTITCQSCWSTGNILGYVGGTNASGGIYGEYAGDGGQASAINCYSTGAIGSQCGGIYARFAGRGGISVATNCYSLGAIAASGGGIYAHYAGPTGNAGTPASVSASNCYSAGSITTAGTGIYGSNKVNGTTTNCYSANGNWSSANANLSLTGLPNPIVGSTWIATILNQPYELRNIGYSPYSVNNILQTNNLKKVYTQTVNINDSTNPAIIGGKSYQILDKTGGNMTIDSTTGVISTLNTAVGVYTLYIRNTGSYHISEFELTIINPNNGYPIIMNTTSKLLSKNNNINYYCCYRIYHFSYFSKCNNEINDLDENNDDCCYTEYVDRKGMYNCIKSVIMNNTNINNRLNTNNSLVKNYNYLVNK